MLVGRTSILRRPIALRVVSKQPSRSLSTKPDFFDIVEDVHDPFQTKNGPLSALPELIPPPKGHLPLANRVCVKKLPSGQTLVAIDEPVPVTTMSLFVKAGARFEHDKSLGASHFLKRLAFRSTQKKYFYPLIRDIDVRGSEFISWNTRDHIAYSITGLRSEQENMAQSLGAVWEPRLEEWEVERVRSEAKFEMDKSFGNSKRILFDALHREAFRDQGLANSTIVPSYNVDHLSSLEIRKFVNTFFLPERQTIIGNGTSIEHLEALSEHFLATNLPQLVQQEFGSELLQFFPAFMPPSPIPNDIPSTYTGGSEIRIPGSGSTHLLMAAEGTSQDLSSRIALSLLQFVLGGGSSSLYNNLLPGFGRHSRLGQQVYSSNLMIHEAFAFNFNYSDAGLFGIYLHAAPNNVPHLFNIIQEQLSNLHNISDEEIIRARAQLKNSTLSSLYSDRLAAAEFYANNINQFGKALTPTQFVSEIDLVGKASIISMAKNIASSKLTVAALGDIKGLPRL